MMMNQPKFFTQIHPAIISVGGLGLTQVIATVHVYRSNRDLFNTLELINAAGYLTIPYEHAATRLLAIGPAFWGGLFFTLTIGAGISLIAMTVSWIWVRNCRRGQIVLLICIGMWLVFLVLVNWNGMTLMPTLYFLLVPPAVFTMTARRASTAEAGIRQMTHWLHFAVVPLLALLWFTQYGANMFIDLRDHLLLSNDFGRNVSRFYYAYTPYPAEAFKSLNQKTIKTAALKEIQTPSLYQRLDTRLRAHDYLPLSDATEVDLNMFQENNLLVFMQNERRIFQVPIEVFFKDSRSALHRFSQACDRYGTFRQFTYFFLLLAFPLLLYLLTHAFFYHLGFFVIGRKASAAGASLMCLLIGISILVYFQSNRSRHIHLPDIPAAVSSDRWQDRVAGLKLVEQNKWEIADFLVESQLASNTTPQDRYWLARAMAYSRRPWTFNFLLNSLGDHNLNVRTMAYYALGLRRDHRAIVPILTKLKSSDNWYEQMYAYRALRVLGWKQTRSH